MSAKRPNIIFLMTDEQRYDTFSRINKEIITPNLDELIKDSVFFNNAYCSNPSCIPSRAAIVTGKFPTQCQTPTYITYLPDDETTFMSMLRDSGYHTAVVGKQHFAKSKAAKGYIDEQIVDGHGPYGDPEEVQLYLDFLEEEGVDIDTLTDDSLIVGGRWKGDIKHHIDDYVGELGKTWLRDYEGDKPFFFTLSFPGPHQPFDGEGTPQSELYKLDEISMPQTTYEMLEDKPPHYKGLNPKAFMHEYDEETYKRTKRGYYANMTLIDEKIGQVVEILKEKGLYEETLIIYSTDHGEFMGDFGMLTKAQYLTEGLMRVPLFVKPPISGFEGIEVDERVLNIDIASTCLRAAGVELGKDMQDYDYTCYWDKDKEVRMRDYIYMEAGNIKGIIMGDMKLYHYMNRSYGELYNLKLDPMETKNLWDEPSYLEEKYKLSRMIINHMYTMTPKHEVPWNVNDPEI